MRTKKLWLVFAVALAAGFALHFVYNWLPNPVTALIAPVNESLWEHGKLLFWPLTAAALYLGGRDREARTARFISALIASIFVIAVGYAYHILLRGESLAVDIALYVIAMALGFWLPNALWPLARKGIWQKAAVALVCVMGALFVWFTFYPPESVIFADLTQGVRTFLTIPV